MMGSLNQIELQLFHDHSHKRQGDTAQNETKGEPISHEAVGFARLLCFKTQYLSLDGWVFGSLVPDLEDEKVQAEIKSELEYYEKERLEYLVFVILSLSLVRESILKLV